jgi:hypothetical protein
MEKYLKVVKITIGDITKTFLVGQDNITKEELINYYNNICKEVDKKHTMEEFLYEAGQYGYDFAEIENNEIPHIIL